MICNDCAHESDFPIGVKEVVANQDAVVVYPNPFVGTLTIEITCSNPEEVKGLSIVDVTGSVICEFSADGFRNGKNVVSWNGLSGNGELVKPGVYLLVYKTSDYSKTIKILRK